MAFNRRAPRYHCAGEDARRASNEGRSQHPRSLFNDGPGLDPYAGPCFLPSGACLGLQSKDVNRKLAQVARVFQVVRVPTMGKSRALATAFQEPAPEQ